MLDISLLVIYIDQAVLWPPPSGEGANCDAFFQLVTDLNEYKIHGNQGFSSNFVVGGPSNGEDQKWDLSHFLKANNKYLIYCVIKLTRDMIYNSKFIIY